MSRILACPEAQQDCLILPDMEGLITQHIFGDVYDVSALQIYLAKDLR